MAAKRDDRRRGMCTTVSELTDYDDISQPVVT